MNRPILRRLLLPVAALLTSAAGQHAIAQSLLEDSGEPELASMPLVAGPSTAENLKGVSLFAVVPPKPKSFKKHDLVEVIINESSVSKMEQTLDIKKNYSLAAELSKFPSLRHLLELQLQNGDNTRPPVEVAAKARNKFKGEGDFERKDNLTARISAIVLDVKPNGTLVIEARESRQEDEEIYTLVLSGMCRSEDITRNNTIQSSQLAELNIRIDHEGQVDKAGDKGLIPRVLDAIFNF